MISRYYKFILTAIFMIFNISDINNYQDLTNLDDSYDQALPVLIRYGRQTPTNVCIIPVHPRYTKYRILKQLEPSYTKSGDLIPNYATIGLICNKGYKLNPLAQNFSVCIGGTWTPPLTICARACRSLKSIVSTNVSCKQGTTPLDNCYHPIDSTTAHLSCNPLYEHSNMDNYPSYLCSDGRWEPPISQCYPSCGQKRSVGSVNIINGADTVRGDYPWHVGIYNASDKSYLCGGSIIERNIILSAAHCFADYDGNVFSSQNYLVAAGKYYRVYDHASDEHVQYSKIQKINVPERYKGTTTVQALDIAVLILEDPFTLSSAVQPVCIELNERLQQLHLSSSSVGIVTGWGYTQEGRELANVLKEIKIPIIPYQKCYDEIPMNFRRYVTQDKLCGGYKDSGTSICSGDSGGGLVFNNRITDRFYIKGIVSTSPATARSECDSNQYSLFTSITDHIKFIRDIVATNRIQHYVECKYDKCASEETPEDIDTIKPVDPTKCCTPFPRCDYYACKSNRVPLFKRMVEILL